MTESKGIGRGNSVESRRSLQTPAPSARVVVGVTLRLRPLQAEKLKAVENRSGAIAEFLSQHWEEFMSFQAGWEGDRYDD